MILGGSFRSYSQGTSSWREGMGDRRPESQSLAFELVGYQSTLEHDIRNRGMLEG